MYPPKSNSCNVRRDITAYHIVHRADTRFPRCFFTKYAWALKCHITTSHIWKRSKWRSPLFFRQIINSFSKHNRLFSNNRPVWILWLKFWISSLYRIYLIARHVDETYASTIRAHFMNSNITCCTKTEEDNSITLPNFYLQWHCFHFSAKKQKDFIRFEFSLTYL